MPKTKEKKETDPLKQLGDESFKNICDHIPGMVAVYNIHTRKYLYVSSAIKKLLGYKSSDFINNGVNFAASLVHPDDMGQIMQKNNEAIKKANKYKKTSPTVSFEYRMRHAKGHYIWIRTDGSVFSRKDGKVECVLNISFDITSHKNMEAELAHSATKIETAERFALSQQAAKVGTYEWHVNENVVEYSPELEALSGLKPGSFGGSFNDWIKCIHPEDRDKAKKTLKKACESGSDFNTKYRIIHKDGTIHWMRARGKAVTQEDGKVIRYIGACVDITDSQKVEDRLRASEERYQAFIKSSNEGIWRFELNKPIPINLPAMQQIQLIYKHAYLAEANEPMAKMYKTELLDHLIGARLGDFLTQNNPKNIEYLKSFIKSGYKISNAESFKIDSEGNEKYYLNSLVGIVDNGYLIRAWGTRKDVTDQHKWASALKKSEERYRAFIRNSGEGIWRMEIDTPFSVKLPVKQQIKMFYKNSYLAEVNNAMASMYGYKTAKELIGVRLNQLWIEDDPKNVEFLKKFIESGYSLSNAESHEQDIDGNDKYFLNNFFGIIENGKLTRAWGTQQDVTEQHKAADALYTSEERLNLALKASRLGIWEWDLITGDLAWSNELKKMFGLKESDSITYQQYLSMLDNRDAVRIQEVIKQSLKTGNPYQLEHRIVWPDGSSHWILGQGQAFLENGKPVRMIGSSINIDERKSAEQLKVKMAQLRSERSKLIEINKAKDEFIAITSHQLRTPATGVKQYLGLLLEGYADPLTENQQVFLEKAYENNERQLYIVDELLRIAQLDLEKIMLHPRQTDISELLQETIASLKGKTNNRKQKVSLIKPKQQVFAAIDSDHFRLALENLIENASNYSEDGKKITINLNQLKSGEVKITIQDEGVGINQSDLPKLFQKFSRINNRLSANVNGTGLGLYFVKKIIELHGGSIKVSSQVNKGSAFVVKIPK